MNDDLYSILGVPKEATADEIKAAGRKKVKATHPDHGGDPETFHKVTQALTVLRDPQKRDFYDNYWETCEIYTAMAEEQMAMSILSQMLGAIVAGSDDPRYVNVPSKMRNDIKAMIGRMKGEIRTHEGKAKRIGEFKKRLKFAGKGDDALARVLEAQAREAEAMVSQIKSMIRTHEMAYEMVDAYLYESEPMPPKSPYETARDSLLSPGHMQFFKY